MKSAKLRASTKVHSELSCTGCAEMGNADNVCTLGNGSSRKNDLLVPLLGPQTAAGDSRGL